MENVNGARMVSLGNVTLRGGSDIPNKPFYYQTSKPITYAPILGSNNVKVETINFDHFVSDKDRIRTVKGEKGSYTFGGAGNVYRTISVEGTNYIVCKTKADLYEYVSYIKDARLYQEAKKKYKSKCQSLSYIYAFGLFSNRRNYGDSNVEHSNCGGTFCQFIDSDMNTMMEIIYSEITNGRPVVLQVNGDEKGTSRHFVTVVGFRRNVASGSQLRQEDLLIIDSFDGQIERMDKADSRFMITGSDCKKDYDGYYLLYIKHNTPSPSTTAKNQIKESSYN